MTTIIIEMNDKNQVNVAGPIGNKVLCLGLLELAKKLVIDFQGEEPQKILVPRNGLGLGE